jgi:hypothetical protein
MCKATARMGWKMLENLPYSLDISPCDYFLLAQKPLQGHWFELADVISKTDMSPLYILAVMIQCCK